MGGCGRLALALIALCCLIQEIGYTQEEQDDAHYLAKSLPATFDFKVIEESQIPAGFYAALADMGGSLKKFPEYVPLDDVLPPRSQIIPQRFEKKADGIGPMLVISPAQWFNVSNGSLPMGLLGRSETALASSRDGANVIVGWNDPSGFLDAYSGQGLTSFAYSTDSGNTFTVGKSLPTFPFDTTVAVPRGDPAIAISTGPERIYFANLAADKGITEDLGILISRGTFNGQTTSWDATRLIPAGSTILDKEAIATDPRPGSGLVYCAATCYTGPSASSADIRLYRSTDAGDSWTGPVIMSHFQSLDQQGVALVPGPSGEVYAAWEGARNNTSAAILFCTSTDQGASFTPSHSIASITPTGAYPPVGFNRFSSNDFPRLAVDYSPAHPGRIYCVYQNAGSNPFIHTNGVIVNTVSGYRAPTGGVIDGDIYLISSDDHGTTWSAPVLISSDFPGDGKNQFWPVIAVDPNGVVDILYYQDNELQPRPLDTLATNVSLGNGYRRRSSFQSLVDIVWRQSLDGGQTFSAPVPINEATANWSISASNIVPNYGDYIASTAVNGSLYTAWAQAISYDIDPGPAVNNRFVPSVAFTAIGGTRQPVIAKQKSDLQFNLAQNYPNPFNPTTRISFDIPSRQNLSLKVYNLIGQEVATLMLGVYDAGRYSVEFDGANLPSGVYAYQLQTENKTSMKKMLLLK